MMLNELPSRHYSFPLSLLSFPANRPDMPCHPFSVTAIPKPRSAAFTEAERQYRQTQPFPASYHRPKAAAAPSLLTANVGDACVPDVPISGAQAE
jgi:hypothetical protein